MSHTLEEVADERQRGVVKWRDWQCRLKQEAANGKSGRGVCVKKAGMLKLECVESLEVIEKEKEQEDNLVG